MCDTIHFQTSLRYEGLMRHIYEWVMSNIWMGHVTHMNGSCHIYEWVMSNIWMRRVIHMNETCYTYEWDFHIWQSSDSKVFCVTLMNGSCQTYQWVVLHIWMRLSYLTRLRYKGLICHAYEWVTSNIWMSHVIRTNETFISDTSQKRRSNVSHMTRLLLFRFSLRYMWHTCGSHMWHIKHSKFFFLVSCATHETKKKN